MYNSITSFYFLSGAIALLLALLGTSLFAAWGYRGILRLRKEMLYDTRGLSLLVNEIREIRKNGGNIRGEDQIRRERATIVYSEEEQQETISKTGFFNILEGLAVPVRAALNV
eukprot:403861-Hanusia_phi.AAC.4